MSKEYYNIQQEADEVKDGGGKLSPDDFIDNGDGTVSIEQTIKDGDKEIPVELKYDENGKYQGYSVLIDDKTEEMSDEDILESEAKIEEAGRTIGSYYKENMKQKQVVPSLKAELDTIRAENEALKARMSKLEGNNEDEMSQADAKKWFGVDSVEEVEEMQRENYASWVVKNARYAASLATPAATKPTPVKPVRTPPRNVPKGEGGGFTPHKVSKDELVTGSIITGATKT